MAGCSETVVLGSECPNSDGLCSSDAGLKPPPEAQEDAEADAQADAQPTEEADAEADAELATCAPSSSVLAYWPLDERSGAIAADASEHGSTGTLQNFSSPVPWSTGNIAGALQLDGVDDQIQVGPVQGELKTLALWLKPGTTQVVSHRTPTQLPTSHGPLNQWLDPQNAYADDNIGATTGTLLGVVREQHWGGFRLAEHLPRDAQIRGITVTVDTGNLGVLGGLVVELSWDGGTSHTNSNYGWGQLIIGSNLRQAGGPDKLWGRNWTTQDFSAANFRVRGTFNGLVNAMSVDFIGVEIQYVEQATGRTIVALSPETAIEFGGADGKEVVASGWPDSATYVNGSLDGRLAEGWNHVAVVGAGLSASEVRLGNTSGERLVFSYEGLMDDVLLLDEALTPQQIDLLHALSCGQ